MANDSWLISDNYRLHSFEKQLSPIAYLPILWHRLLSQKPNNIY